MATSTTHKPKPAEKKERYIETTGGRKTAEARARLFSSGNGIVVNEKDYKAYFRDPKQQAKVMAPFATLNMEQVRATVRVRGGGISAQAEAVRNAIAKALVKLDQGFKKRLKRSGFIKRDARMVERKKYGLKKARRAPQWAKR